MNWYLKKYDTRGEYPIRSHRIWLWKPYKDPFTLSTTSSSAILTHRLTLPWTIWLENDIRRIYGAENCIISCAKDSNHFGIKFRPRIWVKQFIIRITASALWTISTALGGEHKRARTNTQSLLANWIKLFQPIYGRVYSRYAKTMLQTQQSHLRKW